MRWPWQKKPKSEIILSVENPPESFAVVPLDEVTDPMHYALMQAMTGEVGHIYQDDDGLWRDGETNESIPSLNGDEPEPYEVLPFVDGGVIGDIEYRKPERGITLEEAEANIGRGVVYRQNWKGAPVEEGIIRAVRHPYVMVLYRGDYSAKATNPEDLEFAHS